MLRMKFSGPTKEEADELVAAKKIVSAFVCWTAAKPSGWRLKVKAISLEPRAVFTVTGFIGRTNYSFALLHNNFPIRKYTKHSLHTDRGKQVREPHKHVWDTKSADTEVYIPSDINPADDINTQFLCFCRECNIELKGNYQPVLIGPQK